MNFVKMSKHELNICIWELINKKEDDFTWDCFKRLQKPSPFIVSLYKKTCKLNSIDIDEEIISKIKASIDATVDVKPIDVVNESEDEEDTEAEEVATTPEPPKMISRKRK